MGDACHLNEVLNAMYSVKTHTYVLQSTPPETLPDVASMWNGL